MKKIVKTGLIVIGMAGAYVLGEYVNPADKAQERFRDKYISREEGFYKGKLDLVTPINENKREEIYLVEKATGKLHPIGQIDSLPVVNPQVASVDYKVRGGWTEFKNDVKDTYESVEDKVKEWSGDTKEWWEEKTKKDEVVVDTTAAKESGWFKQKYEGVKERFRKD